MKNYKKTLLACYLGFITQAICANFTPLLFITFHNVYSIKMIDLALISTTFYFTQLITDLVCAKFVDKIGYRISVIISEVVAGIGLIGFAIVPDLFSKPFTGILLCVILYAIGSGLIEVLVNPIVEACPFDNKASVMSLLHSFYCWGAVGVILGSTLFFSIFGINNWKILSVIWAIIPIYNIYNFATCPIEKLVDDGKGMTIIELFKTKIFLIFIILLVCSGASEMAMAQWASAFAESALKVSKTIGDLIGPCGFAICMGISRVFYGKYGEKIDLKNFMIISGILCVACYLVAGISKIPIIGLIGCAICGFSVGIMWPGSISISSKILSRGGIAMFALLALAGDLGGAMAPAIVGVVSQKANENLQKGLIASIGFPIILVICVIIIKEYQKSI